jgi:hypothetical protein
MTDFHQLSRVIHVINLRTIGLVLLAGAVITGAGVSAVAISRDLNTAVLAAPDTFTELYFASAKQLPDVLPVGAKHTLKFVVVNHQSEVYSYRYRATLIDKQGSKVVKTGIITLQPGQPIVVPVAFTPTVPDTSLTLVVELLDEDLSIHFRSTS